MNIKTNQYQGVHGKAPRGTGCWAFTNSAGQVVFAPAYCTLSEAKAWLWQSNEVAGMSRLVRNKIVWQVAP